MVNLQKHAEVCKIEKSSLYC